MSERTTYDGITYYRYGRYFTPSGANKRKGYEELHREVWKRERGPIPPGWDVHHLDRDPANNEVSNLLVLPADDHRRLHADDPRWRTATCAQCAAEYASVLPGRFCSNACKSAHRRAAQVDDEERVCAWCGSAFQINKYKKTVTCTKSCSAKMRWQSRRS